MEDYLFAKHLKKPQGEIGKKVGEIMNSMNEYMILYTYKKMNIQDGDNILEIGFGNGQFINELFKINNNICYNGIELSETMLNEALKLNLNLVETNKIELILGSASNMNYPNNFFSKICIINTIYFFKDLKYDLKEVFRVLENFGMLFISIRSKELLSKEGFVKHYFNLYEFDEIKEILVSVGFTNIKNNYEKDLSSNIQKDLLCITAQKAH